jgi:hypothetical protein
MSLDRPSAALAGALDTPLPEVPTDDILRRHPLAVWLGLAFGLEDGHKLRRRRSVALADATSASADAAERHEASDRWRELYRSARAQLEEANRRSETTGLTGMSSPRCRPCPKRRAGRPRMQATQWSSCRPSRAGRSPKC